MGSIERYETRSGRRYRVRYRDPDRRSREKAGFRHKTGPGSATEFLATVTIDISRGSYLSPEEARVTIGQLGPAWLAAQVHLKPSSWAPLEGAWRVWVQPRWGDTPPRLIRYSDIQSWIGDLIAGTAPTTRRTPKALGSSSVIRIAGVLSGILDVAVRDKRIIDNPAHGVKLPRKRRKRRAYLAHHQVELLASNAGAHATLVRLLAYTGLRWGEAIALRSHDINLNRKRISIVENAVRVNGVVHVGTPKADQPRVIAIPPFLIPELRLQLEERPADALAFGDGTRHLSPATGKGGWYHGAVTRSRQLDPEFPAPTVHDLRHTAASLAISAGANVKVIQRMLGHASAAMTLDVYADLFDHDLDNAADTLSKARAAALMSETSSEAVQGEP